MALYVPVAPLRRGEPAVSLYEMDDIRNGRLHRIQCIRVIRNDKIVEFEEDLGLSSRYPGAQPFAIPGLLEETVASLKEYADALREDRSLAEALDEARESSTLLERYHDNLEQVREFAKRNQRTLRNLEQWQPRNS